MAFGAGIDRRSVADQTYQHLRAAILSGEIPQGARLMSSVFAICASITRAPVREAVNRLLQEGLLESRTHHGPLVIQMTPEKIRWLYDLRARSKRWRSATSFVSEANSIYLLFARPSRR